MGNFAKWIGGGLGWALGGPLGAVLGFAAGTFIDQAGGQMRQIEPGVTTRGDFAASLLVLIAAVMNADKKVLSSELEYVRHYFVQNFGMASAQEAMLMLRDILKQTIPVRDVATQIKNGLDYPSRLQLVHFLYEIAHSDQQVSAEEIKVIGVIAGSLGISEKDIWSLQSMYYKDVDSAYKVLEIERTATDEEVKKAYRRMAVKYHPDKVSYLGEEVRKTANEKFRKVNEAYERIKKERGMN
jgi:DnaJ like chaperone protein